MILKDPTFYKIKKKLLRIAEIILNLHCITHLLPNSIQSLRQYTRVFLENL